MPLERPSQFFHRKTKEQEERLSEEAARKQAIKDSKRLRGPSSILGRDLQVETFTPRPKPQKKVAEVEQPKPEPTITEKINLLSERIPESHMFWERLSGIENSISSLHMDKLERDEVLRVYENLEELKELVESIEIPEVRYYEDEVDVLIERDQQLLDNIEALSENTEHSIKDVNDKILKGNVSFTELQERVESIVIPDIEGNREGVDTLKRLHESLKEAVNDIPNQKSRFDPSPILESLSDLRDNLTVNISDVSTKLNEKVDALPEIRHYEDDLDLLQNFITEVKSSIKYYDSDVDELKKNILDLGKTIGETINTKVKNLQRGIREGDKKQSKSLTEAIDALPEVKYYDEEINGIEVRINDLLTTTTELPEVKYYDDDVKSLTEAVTALNKKIDSIDIPDWTDVIENIKGEVAGIKDLQADFDQRWEKAAETKDPLNNTEFVTFEQMRQHYKTFIERVQIQLGTIGGGGAVEVMEMDDIAADFRAYPENYDRAYLQHVYNPVTKKSEFTATRVFLSDVAVTGGINDLDDVNVDVLQDGMLLVWNASSERWTAVTPQSLGINNDFNPDPDIEDYGTYQ